ADRRSAASQPAVGPSRHHVQASAPPRAVRADRAHRRDSHHPHRGVRDRVLHHRQGQGGLQAMGGMIEWEDPRPRSKGKWLWFFDQLRENPGRWAVFQRDVLHPGGYIEKIKSGIYHGITADEFEIRLVRDPKSRTSTIFV